MLSLAHMQLCKQATRRSVRYIAGGPGPPRRTNGRGRSTGRSMAHHHVFVLDGRCGVLPCWLLNSLAPPIVRDRWIQPSNDNGKRIEGDLIYMGWSAHKHPCRSPHERLMTAISTQVAGRRIQRSGSHSSRQCIACNC